MPLSIEGFGRMPLWNFQDARGCECKEVRNVERKRLLQPFSSSNGVIIVEICLCIACPNLTIYFHKCIYICDILYEQLELYRSVINNFLKGNGWHFFF